MVELGVLLPEALGGGGSGVGAESELGELLVVCELTVDDVVASPREVELTSSLRQDVVPWSR